MAETKMSFTFYCNFKHLFMGVIKFIANAEAKKETVLPMYSNNLNGYATD